jgi:hypothetical protein
VSRPKREVLHPVTARAFLAALDRERRKYVSATPVNYLAENRSKLISTNDLLDVWGELRRGCIAHSFLLRREGHRIETW